MQIRSITCFIDPSNSSFQQELQAAGRFIKIARPAFTQAGFVVQSARLATVPFARLLPDLAPDSLARLAAEIEQAAAGYGYAYVSLGPALPSSPESYGLIPEALATTQSAFFAASLTSANGEISLGAVHRCARIIQQASTISADGFANLRFAALANVPAGSPFFPAAYHNGGAPSFALATEAADLAVTAFEQASRLDAARRSLVSTMELQAGKLDKVAQEVARETGVKFGGIDFSLAPYPEAARSLGVAMERMGVPRLGLHGSLAAAAILADTMDQAEFNRAGFSGLFLPVLEDAILAQRAAEGSLQLVDLLLYSAVCGTGLDTIPLPGDTTQAQIAAVLLDLASLSARLAKPLTARLMPIPGKKAGDPTNFEFPYFANSQVLSLRAAPLSNFLSGEEEFSIRPRLTR